MANVLVKWTLRSGIGPHVMVLPYPEEYSPQKQVETWKGFMGLWVTDSMFIPWHSIHSIQCEIVETDNSKPSNP